jgi:menaquinone-dependent protoporphyrinogen IX oxidase
MHLEYFHASKFGNGARVAEAFKRQMEMRGVPVSIHRVSEVEPAALPSADLYVFSSPGRMGRPIGSVRKFLERVNLPTGTRYAILTTEITAKPDKKTGRMPTAEESCKFQKVRPIMHEMLQDKGLIEVGQDVVHVTDIKGPLEDGWETKVAAFADRLCATPAPSAG